MSDTHATASQNQKAKVIRAEMSLFEGGGQRGLHLDMAYNCLLTIPPSSVESERVFSSAGVTCSKLRTRMSDSVLDDLLFIRSYFKASHETRPSRKWVNWRIDDDIPWLNIHVNMLCWNVYCKSHFMRSELLSYARPIYGRLSSHFSHIAFTIHSMYI